MKDRLRIGELARLFHLDVQTLRLYEDKGLLLPEGREPESNYRFYRADQVYPLALIRYLRRLECLPLLCSKFLPIYLHRDPDLVILLDPPGHHRIFRVLHQG